MSYILDALRKAEHERNVGDTPKLDFSPLSEGAGQHNSVLWGLVGVLGICVGVLGAMQLSEYLAPGARQPNPPDESTAKRDAPAEPESAPNVVIVAPPESAQETAAQTPARAAAPSEPQRRSVQVNTPQGPVEIDMPLASEPSGPQKASQPDAMDARQSEPEPAPQSTARATEPEPQPRPDTARPARDEAAGDETVESRKAPGLSVPSPAELVAEMENGGSAPAAQDQPPPQPESTAEPEPEAPPQQEERLVSYLGLPAGTRNSIGKLTMNAHVYSSTPGRGFCIINGSRYRPGDELQEGPVLREIRLDGAVLEYRGERFLLPVPR